MTLTWRENEFKIGINMAGAVSAGAYTAGVLDFLMEALEEWQSAKGALREYLKNPGTGAPPPAVPLHDITIEVFSGASAGGMCAAIASVMVQSNFRHVTDAKAEQTNNRFYEAWVNQIDISKLLTANDLRNGGPLISLLDSSIIDEIAEGALKPGVPVTREYISKSLTLFLTLTNVRGVQYKLYDDPSPTVNEFTTYYGDRIQFETTAVSGVPSAPLAKPLPLGQADTGAWGLLREAAMATGAFPIFLAPRVLTRDLSDYNVPAWFGVNQPPPGPPIVSDLPVPPPPTIQTLNIDGGVTDNSPFNLAHDYLAGKNPLAANGHNPREAEKANCAVITVAPFPSTDRYDPDYFKKKRGLAEMLDKLVTVLVSQSRFQGESLSVLTSGTSFSRFVIAPSDPEETSRNALQCASLGAFGGFLERSFRAHDFLLGRRNCQRFLQCHFLLPFGNPVIQAGLAQADSFASTIKSDFGQDPERDCGAPGNWMPLIPLIGSARDAANRPARGAIAEERVKQIADQILSRLDAIKGPLLDGAQTGGVLKCLVGLACSWPVRAFFRSKIAGMLSDALEMRHE